MGSDKFTDAFHEAVSDCREFAEAMSIVKDNSFGKVWVIGGFVFRNIAKVLYGVDPPKVDIDFIVEKNPERLVLPDGWKQSVNRFGNPKLVNADKSIDYVPLNRVYSISSRGLEPTFENYLLGVPLNVQSIAYSVDEKRVVGEVGIDALERRVVKANNSFFVEYASKKKGVKAGEYINSMALSLEFSSVL